MKILQVTNQFKTCNDTILNLGGKYYIKSL